jgi:hypothetical protein
MTEAKSPGAVAALGASVSDQLGRRVTSEANRQQSVTQAPIPATPVGADRCSREGVTADRSARGGNISPTGHAKIALPEAVAQGRRSRGADAGTQVGSPQQHRGADGAAEQEFHQIQKFVAACRRQWPGAMIVLWPDDAPTGANAPPNPKLAPGVEQ